MGRIPRLILDCPRDRPLLVALSGGGDSMALLHLAREGGWKVRAAHLDHALRSESSQEREWLALQCQRWEIPFHSERVDVQALAREQAMGLESAGRHARYRWLRTLARQLGGALVVTGHTREDQAETLLLKIVRGTQWRALAGIRRRRGDWLARPLLDCARADLREYLQERALAWLEDPTNAVPSRPRTWVRWQLLPLLQAQNPQVVLALCRLADSVGGDDLRAVARLWRRAAPDARFTRRHLEGLTRLREGSAISLPGGLSALKRKGELAFQSSGPSLTISSPPEQWLTGDLSAWHLRVTLELGEGRPPSPWSVCLRLASAEGLSVRSRRSGDRFGSQKLKSVLAKLGIPREARDLVPLLCDENGQVLWIVGHRAHPRHLCIEPDARGLSVRFEGLS